MYDRGDARMARQGKALTKAQEITQLGLATALLFVAQVALRPLPNVEVVSLLVILFTLRFGVQTLWIIYAFVFMQGTLYGFHIWWISYLYLWTILWGLTTLFREQKSAYFWAIVSAFFGLSFGILSALPYFFFGGAGMVLSVFVSGMGFDLVHGVSNFFLTLVLFSPLERRFLRGNNGDKR